MVEIPPDSIEDPQWYVALVRSGREQFAKEHLLSSGFDEAFYPRKRSVRHAHGKKLEILTPEFHGYVFVRTFAFTVFLWHDAVRATEEWHPQRGLVRSFSGGWPATETPEHSILRLRSCLDDEDIWLPDLVPEFVPHPPGTLLRAVGGPTMDRLYTVVMDTGGERIDVRDVQSPGPVVYIRRERVEVVTSSEVGPAPRSPARAPLGSKDRAPRPRNRMKRRAILQSA